MSEVKSKFYFELNKRVEQGDDRVIKLVFDTTINDWDFFYTAKSNHSDIDTEAAITVNPSEMIKSESTSGYLNIVEIPLSSVKTDIEPKRYLHDIKVMKPGGVANTIAKGFLYIDPNVTNRISE